MNVSSMLRRKGTRVETAKSQTTVGEAAQQLTSRGIGSLVILDDGGSLLGVLSERDLVRALRTRSVVIGRARRRSPWRASRDVQARGLAEARPVDHAPAPRSAAAGDRGQDPGRDRQHRRCREGPARRSRARGGGAPRRRPTSFRPDPNPSPGSAADLTEEAVSLRIAGIPVRSSWVRPTAAM